MQAEQVELKDSRIDQQTAEIEHATEEMVETGLPVELGNMPQALYVKQEYSGASSLYIILPQHDIAIPYSHKHTIASVLLDKKDITSSQELSDYPIVTHIQLEMWYSAYTIIEKLVDVSVYKQRKTLSGWEQRQLTDRKYASYGHTKTLEKLQELESDPYYAIMSDADKLTHRRKINA